VVPRKTHPDGTGYARGLYTFNQLSPEARNSLEQVFLLRADHLASLALERLLMRDIDLEVSLKSGWSRFIMTLFHRTPESVQRLRQLVKDQLPSALADAYAKYETLKREGDPPTFEEYRASIPDHPDHDVEQTSLMLMRMAMDSRVVGESFNNLVWSVITFNQPRYPLLTSDRPLIMTNGILKEDGHIALPISPNTIFVAARTHETIAKIDAVLKMPRAEEFINDLIVRQAVNYVYGTNDRQLRFVANRFGERRPSTPFG
jgi:hypothetical protein